MGPPPGRIQAWEAVIHKKPLKRIKIFKKSGQVQPFSKSKLQRSLEHTCLEKKSCQAIAEEVTRDLQPLTTTNDIFERTNTLIRKHSALAASQYSLKRALFELGPDGHNFESFVAKYFQELGYRTRECVLMPGLYVQHEVDVVATKKKKKFLVECKFHNRHGIKNDIKTALYVKARWDDLKQGPQGKAISEFYLASNTAFSLDALTYGKGTGLKLLGVNAPEGLSFLDEVKALRLYPVTSLYKISRTQKRLLLKKKIILVKDLLKRPSALKALGLSDARIEDLMEEVYVLTGERK